MGFDYYYVFDIQCLRDELEHYGVDEFKRIYSTYNSILGDSECVTFIVDILNNG